MGASQSHAVAAFVPSAEYATFPLQQLPSKANLEFLRIKFNRGEPPTLLAVRKLDDGGAENNHILRRSRQQVAQVDGATQTDRAGAKACT